MDDQRSDAVLEALLDATSEGVAIVAPDGEILSANAQLLALVPDVDHDADAANDHADPGALGDVNWPELFAADAPDLASLAADDNDDATEGDVTASGGVRRTLAVNATADDAEDGADDAGRPVRVTADALDDAYLATIRDAKPQVERDMYRNILESVQDGIYMLDANGRIEYVNQAVLDAQDISYDREEMEGLFATAIMPADDIEACVEAIQSLIVNDHAESEQVAVTIDDKDDQRIPAELNLSLLPPENGEFAGSVGVLRDVSERRRRDQMLRVLNRVLRHNLRNDMNVIAGLTQLIESEYEGVDGEYTEQIREVASRLVDIGGKARVVEDLTGGSTGPTQSFDVVPIVDRILEQTCESRTAADVAFHAPEEAYASIPPMFETAVANVVENAFEHSSTPRITVSIERHDDAIEIAVHDDGPGIPQAEIDALHSETETPLEHASGLGLWLTDWIVESAGGGVTYDVADGTTVTLEFPTG